jgi:putative ABC transport system ATP-binding protein
VIELTNVVKNYQTDEIETRALAGVSLRILAGEFVAIMGPSGCGKSTLLNVLGLLDSPDSGEYHFDGENVARASERRLLELRRGGLGFIFQGFNLIDSLAVLDNVEVAMLYGPLSAGERRKRALDALERVGLSHRARHLPGQLSGGQQQRVAIARAIVARPKLILADEPTGNLDSHTGNSILDLLREINSAGTTIVMVTHTPAHATVASRTVRMLDGKITSETRAVAA